MVGEMAVTAAKVMLAEIRYEKIYTAEHLSSSGGRLCWDHTYYADHTAGMFKMEVNDPTEK